MKTSHLSARKTRIPLLHRVLAGAFLFSLYCTSHAASFTVSPILGDVPAESGIAVFEIHNNGRQPLPVQVQALAWTQPNGEDVRAPARDVIVVPPLATVPPGETQLVRIALRTRDRSREHAYRILVRELPAQGNSSGGAALRTLLAFDVPLFFAPENPTRNVAWSLERNREGVTLRALSTGSRFLRFANIRLEDRNGRELATLPGPLYVLAGASQSWPVTAPLGAGTHVNVIHSLSGKETTVPLVVK